MSFIQSFIERQTNTEILLFSYYVILSLYAVFVLFSKRNKKKYEKHRSLYNFITYFIAFVFTTISCLVEKMVEPLLPYQLSMFVSAVLFNSLLVNGFFILKFKDVEFVRETAELTNFARDVEKIDAILTEYIAALNSADDKDVEQLRKYDADLQIEAWLQLIHKFNYIKERKITHLEIMDFNEIDILDFIHFLVKSEHLCYNDSEIDKMVLDLRKQSFVKLTENILLIPIKSQYGTCLCYMESENELSDIDARFISSAFSVYRMRIGG